MPDEISKQLLLAIKAVKEDPTQYLDHVVKDLNNLAKKAPGRVLPIGISGLAGSGKDSATTLIMKLWNVSIGAIGQDKFMNSDVHDILGQHLSIYTCHFADPLKEIAEVMGFTYDQVHGQSLKSVKDEFWQITPREFLQMCGTEMFRKVWRDDVWVQLARKRIKVLKESIADNESIQDIVFIPDVRFPNEADMIKKEGGLMIRISRAGIQEMNHASENQVKDLSVDIEMINDSPTPEEWSIKFTDSLCDYSKGL